jgi:Ca2+:H+ antiporter
MRRSEQHFNAAAARSHSTMLTLAAIALILPAAFRVASGTTTEALGRLSISISAVLLLMYLLYLVFALMTHSSLFAGSRAPDEGNARARRGVCEPQRSCLPRQPRSSPG